MDRELIRGSRILRHGMSPGGVIHRLPRKSSRSDCYDMNTSVCQQYQLDITASNLKSISFPSSYLADLCRSDEKIIATVDAEAESDRLPRPTGCSLNSSYR
jgi:hypothetical protein